MVGASFYVPAHGTFSGRSTYQELKSRMCVMKAYLANIPMTVWALIALPALVVTRCVVQTVVPEVVHAVVPEVVRTVLKVI
jgi:hypothetical protein